MGLPIVPEQPGTLNPSEELERMLRVPCTLGILRLPVPWPFGDSGAILWVEIGVYGSGFGVESAEERALSTGW